MKWERSNIDVTPIWRTNLKIVLLDGNIFTHTADIVPLLPFLANTTFHSILTLTNLELFSGAINEGKVILLPSRCS